MFINMVDNIKFMKYIFLYYINIYYMLNVNNII